MFFLRIVILSTIFGLEFVSGQQYILDPRFHFQVPDDYNVHKKPIEYQQQFPGFSSFEPFIPQKDLQTSDLPAHLQKTLPQYRFNPKDQAKISYHNGVLYRTDHEDAAQNIAPSTHRPNYSNIFSKNHHFFPSPTETYIGQVSSDGSFRNLDNTFKNYDNFKNGDGKPVPTEILRQHTRILAPDPEDKQNQLQEKKYFVNEQGEVIPPPIISPKRLSTKLEVQDDTTNTKDYPRYNVINNYDKTSYLSQSEDQDDLDDYDYEEDTKLLTTPKNIRSSDRETSENNVKTTYDYEEDTKLLTTPKNTRTNASETRVKNENNVKPSESSKATKSTEPVVSVVTTKSVINNTVIATEKPPVTSITTDPTNVDNSTDSWVVVASVQTSKSISGAHYLPSSIVAQRERFALLNEKVSENNSSEEYSSYEEESNDSTTEEPITMTQIKHSTESLIDKLDRVQSDLSSGLLTGGYKNEDNNIAVITENMTDKIQVITESPAENSQLFPSVSKNNLPVIKKFSSRSRPPTSNLYPKRKPQVHKKVSTTPKPIPVNNEKTENNVPNIVIAKPDAFLPPGYKAPVENDGSSELLAELLKKFKDSKTDVAKAAENEPKGESSSSASVDDMPHHRFGAAHATTTKIESNNEQNSTSINSLLKIAKPVDISSFLPPGYRQQTESKQTQVDKPLNGKVEDLSPSTTKISIDDILNKAKQEDISAFLPPGYKPPEATTKKKLSKIDELLQSSKEDDVSAFLPPGFKAKETDISSFLPAGYKPLSETTTMKKPSKIDELLQSSKEDDVSAFLPPGFKAKETDISSFLPPGYKPQEKTTMKKISKIDELLQSSKEDDVSAFLPPGYKSKSTSSTSPRTKLEEILENSKKDDISAFLPAGFKPKFTTRKPKTTANIESEDLPTSLLPSGYKPRKVGTSDNGKTVSSTEMSIKSSSTTEATTTTKGSLKVVFPSRPGGKRMNHKLTTQRPREERKEVTQAAVPTIHKGWPTRATTEFTGWPTPSTTPISIEKLLESVQRVFPTSAEPENITSTTSTQTTITSTTTTPKPTTPGVCTEECDLVGTIKLVDGVRWVPELLDRNTKEWQILANEVQSQLEEVYSKSQSLKDYFKNLRIDGFSQGSVLVDYLVELENTHMHMSTSQMKKLFNEALETTMTKSTVREGKALNESVKYIENAKLGKFIIDPMFTDFIIVPKQSAPTVAYAEEDLLLPQWAIAVMVIGLASLLFVIIFGVTVLVNRSKNAKKKAPIPLTDDMLNELNKDHMGGYDNYGIEDSYNIEAGFWDPRRIEAHREYNKLPKKASAGSIHDNSMTNLYDSWNSQNNGYNNSSAGSYFGHQPGPAGSHRLYERRRSYDTNF